MENILKSNVFNRCEHNIKVMNEIREMSMNINISNNEFLSIRDKLLKSLILMSDTEKSIVEELNNGTL